MSELAIIFGSGAIGVLGGAIGAYAIAKKYFSHDKILDLLDEILTNITQDEKMMQKVYLLGGVLGQGVQSGLGLKQSSGKFKWQDLIGNLIGRYAGKYIGGLEQQPQQTSNTSMQIE